MVLLPADLAASRVQEVILTTTIEKLCEKYGEDSPSVKAFRDERTALYTHIEKLEFLLSKSEDPMLKKEVELKTAAALKRYSDGLTMTKQELANRDKLEEEGFARRHLESKLFYEAERQRLRNLINK